jgi:hypothetical protein
MKKILHIITPALMLTMMGVGGCEKKEPTTEPTENVCDIENPLTDLDWLRNIVNNIEENHNAGFLPNARIYQCTYDSDKTGFLIEPCADCPDAGYGFWSCKGELLCGGGNESGEDTCGEFNIDFANKVLIYELQNYSITF